MITAAQQARINRAQEMLDGWIEAEKALMTAKEYRMGTKMLRREDLSEIRKAIQYWEDKVNEAQGSSHSRITVHQVVPRGDL